MKKEIGNKVNQEDNSPSKPNIPNEKSPTSKPKAKQPKAEKPQKNRPIIDRKVSKSKKTDVYSRGAADSKKSAKVINKTPADPKYINSNGSKEHIGETENQVSLT